MLLLLRSLVLSQICRSLNNLHTAMFIISALTSTPVRRLASTWRLVSSKDMETLKGLETLLDPSGNMRYYRQAIAEAEAPTIPFLRKYLFEDQFNRCGAILHVEICI